MIFGTEVAILTSLFPEGERGRALGFLLSLYLQYIKGFNPQKTGLILISQPIVMAIFSPFAGKLSERIEPRIVASTGMMLTLTSLFLFTFLSEETSLKFIFGV